MWASVNVSRGDGTGVRTSPVRLTSSVEAQCLMAPRMGTLFRDCWGMNAIMILYTRGPTLYPGGVIYEGSSKRRWTVTMNMNNGRNIRATAGVHR